MNKFFLKICLIIFFISVFLINSPWNNTAFALVDGIYNTCPNAQGCLGDPPQAYNGPSYNDSGGCGNPTHDAQTQPWTHYTSVCVQVNPGDPCTYAWEVAGAVCSTGDKCVNPGSDITLSPGYCACGQSGSAYKTCCNNTNTQACIEYSVQDNYPPPEGVCPAGTTTVPCGGAGQPKCGQDACNSLATPTPTPTPPPPGSTPTPTPTGTCTVRPDTCGSCGVNCQKYCLDTCGNVIGQSCTGGSCPAPTPSGAVCKPGQVSCPNTACTL